MSLRTIAKATSYLYTSSDSYEKQLEGSQRSYQARRSDEWLHPSMHPKCNLTRCYPHLSIYPPPPPINGQPMTEAMSGMGIGLPISRLYARHWGGDIRVISVQGWGTDVAIYINKKDLPENGEQSMKAPPPRAASHSHMQAHAGPHSIQLHPLPTHSPPPGLRLARSR